MIERVNFCADDEQTKRQDAKRQIWTHFKPPFKGSHNLDNFFAYISSPRNVTFKDSARQEPMKMKYGEFRVENMVLACLKNACLFSNTPIIYDMCEKLPMFQYITLMRCCVDN